MPISSTPSPHATRHRPECPTRWQPLLPPNLRLTFIDGDGQVVYDNLVGSVDTMEKPCRQARGPAGPQERFPPTTSARPPQPGNPTSTTPKYFERRVRAGSAALRHPGAPLPQAGQHLAVHHSGTFPRRSALHPLRRRTLRRRRQAAPRLCRGGGIRRQPLRTLADLLPERRAGRPGTAHHRQLPPPAGERTDAGLRTRKAAAARTEFGRRDLFLPTRRHRGVLQRSLPAIPGDHRRRHHAERSASARPASLRSPSAPSGTAPRRIRRPATKRAFRPRDGNFCSRSTSSRTAASKSYSTTSPSRRRPSVSNRR